MVHREGKFYFVYLCYKTVHYFSVYGVMEPHLRQVCMDRADILYMI